MYFDKEQNEVRTIATHSTFGGLADTNVLVLSSEQVEAIKLVIDRYNEEHKKPKQDMQRVYIAEYTTHDDYGPLRETDVFSKEEDAWAFVLKQRDEGATNISVKPRLVYLDNDRTVNFDD